MSAIGELEALAARTRLLEGLTSEQHSIDRSAEFTRRAAWHLRAAGWGNVRKESGLNVRGLDVDKILNRNTLEMIDIVISAGALNPRVGWQPVGSGTPGQFVAPRDEDAGGMPAPPPTPGGPTFDQVERLTDVAETIGDALVTSDPAVETVMSLLRRLEASQKSTEEHVGRIRAVLDDAARRFL